MSKKMKNFLIILGVTLEVMIFVVYGFEVLPVPKTVCLLLWCLLAVWICRLADNRKGKRKARIRRHGGLHNLA